MKYWVISPYDSGKDAIWERAWKYDLTNDTIAIGWRELGDIASYKKDKLEEVIGDTYTDATQRANALSFGAMWNFWHEIKKGDTIIARKGIKQLVAIGTVTQTAFYDPKMGKNRVGNIEHYYPNFIRVQWHDSPRDVVFDEVVFAQSTIYKPSEDKLKKILDTSTDDGKDNETIILERYLEEIIVANFNQVFEGKLKLYENHEGDGHQYSTDIGVIDILAENPETKTFVVIELKKGRGVDVVVGQILRYMGWVDEVLCKDGERKVKGIIICTEADPKLLSALRMVPSIELKYYSIDFKLKPVNVERSHNVQIV